MNFDAERREKIVKDHPNLFPRFVGFEHGDGWLDLIEELCNELEMLVIKWKKDNPDEVADVEECGFMTVSQIKEKYGQLRFYMSSATDEMAKIIDKAEDISSTICEQCGQPGKLRGEHWYSTACDACWSKMK